MSTLDKYFNKISPDLKGVAETVRSTVLAASPKIEESLKWGHPCYEVNGKVCYIQANKKHVSLGFFEGAKLKSANNLEGSGSKLRHIKYKEKSDVKKTKITKLVKEAVKLNG